MKNNKPLSALPNLPLTGAMNKRNFTRKVENFVCEQCGFEVEGDGYTDHCPKCLWGKHVDMDIPGDRSSDCKGAMEPVRVLYEKGDYKIDYKCVKCGYEFRVRSDRTDDREELLKRVV